MNWKHYLLLASLGLAVSLVVAVFQSAPGYMDADYYFAGGVQLASGHGFTEPYLWNYLDNPAGLPHPSNAYWMPLASMLAAAGMALSGHLTWFAARLGFLVVAAALPPLTAALAYSLTSHRDLALTSGLLAVFSGFYLPFLPVSDTFGLYMLFGGLFFLVGSRESRVRSLFLGVIAGLMHLTRADGLLWLVLSLLATFFIHRPSSSIRRQRFTFYVLRFSLVIVGYLLVMSPWLIRNWIVFGTPLAPGGGHAFWLTRYDQLFSYPASQLTFVSWWQAGWAAALKVRFWALGLNLANALAVQAAVFLLPFILIGFWQLRRDGRVQLAALAWILTLGAMTVTFPFAGARGGFFHSGAALQPVLWALAPLGLIQVINWGVRKRGWMENQARLIFQTALVGAAALVSIFVVQGRVVGGLNGERAWGQEDVAYSSVAVYLASEGASPEAVVMVSNPPGYYLASGNLAVAVPDGDVETVLAVARKYGAQYLVLEEISTPSGLRDVFENPGGHTGLHYLGEAAEARIFAIQP